MSYLVGNLETSPKGLMKVQGLGATITLPDPSTFFGTLHNLLPAFSTSNNAPVPASEVKDAAATSGLTEEQIRAMLAQQGRTVDDSFMASLPKWALPVGLAAVVGGFVLMRKKG